MLCKNDRDAVMSGVFLTNRVFLCYGQFFHKRRLYCGLYTILMNSHIISCHTVFNCC